MRELQNYHLVWLRDNPKRSEAWLRERLKDGFHIHHMDGDHSNDDPSNLVLIEGGDHFMLHGAKLLYVPRKPKQIKPVKPARRGPKTLPVWLRRKFRIQDGE